MPVLPVPRSSHWPFVVALGVAFGAVFASTSVRGFAEDAKPAAAPWAAAEAAVVAAEKDPAQRAAARTAVDAAIVANPGAAGPHLLAARVWMTYAVPAKKTSVGDQAFNQALVSCSKAAEIDLRDPAPWRLRLVVLDEMNAGAADVLEANRALAIRLPADGPAREAFKKVSGGKIPQLKNGDPLPLVVWKDSAGKDVAVADLWAARPLVIELFRTTTWCEFCRKRLYELHDHAKDFESANVSLVAVSPESGDLIAAIEKDGLKGRKPFRVRILADPKGTQADKLNVLNFETVKPGTAADAFGLPHPTTIVVDTKGIIRLFDTHEDFRDRTKLDEIFAVIKRIQATAPPK
jgi:peroxiredoxin